MLHCLQQVRRRREPYERQPDCSRGERAGIELEARLAHRVRQKQEPCGDRAERDREELLARRELDQRECEERRRGSGEQRDQVTAPRLEERRSDQGRVDRREQQEREAAITGYV